MHTETLERPVRQVPRLNSASDSAVIGQQPLLRRALAGAVSKPSSTYTVAIVSAECAVAGGAGAAGSVARAAASSAISSAS